MTPAEYVELKKIELMPFELQGQRRARPRLCGAAAVALMAVLTFAHSAQTRDLPKTDPDRKLLLDSARGQDNVKLIVKDLYKDGDFALLCALRQDAQGGIIGTDDMLDVSEWVLIRDDGRWIARGTGGGLAYSVSSASCAKAPKSKADIIDALLRAVRWELLDEMMVRHSIDEYSPLFELLERKGHATGVPMDEENELPQFRVITPPRSVQEERAMQGRDSAHPCARRGSTKKRTRQHARVEILRPNCKPHEQGRSVRAVPPDRHSRACLPRGPAPPARSANPRTMRRDAIFEHTLAGLRLPPVLGG